jgi:hypothetical protein
MGGGEFLDLSHDFSMVILWESLAKMVIWWNLMGI